MYSVELILTMILPPFAGGIYVSDAYVLRGSEPRGYPFLEAPQRMSFIAVAGQ